MSSNPAGQPGTSAVIQMPFPDFEKKTPAFTTLAINSRASASSTFSESSLELPVCWLNTN